MSLQNNKTEPNLVVQIHKYVPTDSASRQIHKLKQYLRTISKEAGSKCYVNTYKLLGWEFAVQEKFSLGKENFLNIQHSVTILPFFSILPNACSIFMHKCLPLLD